VLVDANGGKSINPVLLALAIVMLLTTLASAAMWLSARNQLKSKDSEIANLNLQLAGTRGGADSRKQISDLNADKSQLQDKLQASIASLTVTENERDALAKQVASLTQQLNARASQHTDHPKEIATPPPPHLSVAYFQVYSSDDGVNRVPGPFHPVASNALRFVLCQLGGPNPLHANQDLSAGIEVRFLAPGGSLRRVVTQEVTAARNQVLWTSQAAWGNSKPGTFQSGLWRIEVWSGPDKLGEKTFQVN
jgi:hypothetical protein